MFNIEPNYHEKLKYQDEVLKYDRGRQ